MTEAKSAKITPDPQLLEAIYNATVTPESYDHLMLRWQELLENAVDALGDRRRFVAENHDLIELSQTIPHLKTSFRILEALGREDAGTDKPVKTGNGKPKFMVDAKGQIVWFNGIAVREFMLTKNMTIGDLKLGDSALVLTSQAIAQIAEAAEMPKPFVIAIESKARGRAVHMAATTLTSPEGERHLILEELEAPWHDSIETMLQRAFGLTKSETGITGMLMRGTDMKEIAELRGSTLATVRTQVKAVLRKTQTHSQNELVRLCMIMAAHFPAAKLQNRRDHSDIRFFELPSGRTMPYRVFGPSEGRPILFLHGMLDGVQITSRIDAILHRLNLRIIGPERPFYGSAEGSTVPVAGALEAFANDAAALVEHLDLKDFILLAHMAGSMSAFAISPLVGDRVRAIVAVAAGVPIVSSQQIKAMSPRQRMIAYTARYAPSALPFILRAGIRQIDAGGARQFMQALYPAGSADRAACDDAEIFEVVSEGYRFAVAQGHRAFEIDSYHVIRDWSHLVDRSPHPVHIFHGCQDPVVKIGSVRDFASRHGDRTTLYEHPHIGQLLYYHEPEFVLEHVARLF
jgi:pimeloyl-ACP methyl ester carboxylesterase/DNA-binding CsgD family transcriptional regulator